ncbi:cytochrome P450 2K1-like isoform X1 [Syngnathoides biaculeatus]|uniref:cytochrome P450 2K1-like isoform X1 n=1 Tax=Syngnathoides biaculeatus TaxID=300417 RepID=UPI002ADD3EA5|nr:cytochrome P450 2K1-like isoform X1 [Syngnathoides biaculeatus]
MSPLEDASAASLSSGATPLLACVTALFLAAFASRRLASARRGGKEPPGPRPLPLLGNLLQLDLTWLDRTLCQLAKRHGSVFTIYLGTRKVVVLAGYKALKEALVGHAVEFGERFITPIFQDSNHGHGILFANGDSWKELRRFALSTLRDFGMGKRLAEEKILEECRHLIPIIESHKGQPFDTTSPLSHATSNIICNIVYGNRFEYSDRRFVTMVKRTNENVRLSGSFQIQLYNMFPRLLSWVKHRRMVLGNRDDSMKDIQELLRQRKEKLNPEMCTGLVDCFFVRKQKEEEARMDQSHFNEENMMFVVGNLFAAGTDTTATTLRWGLLLMAKYPRIQERVHEELSGAVGSRPMNVDDRKNLPYTNAVVHEIQRFANIVPMAIMHQTTQDVTFRGYFIEKGTAVIPLLTSALFDESEWETPNVFNPSHFLDKEGDFVKRDAFLPFSAGRRVCLGEGLARMELFLFFASLLQRFRFTPPPGISEDELDLKPLVGFTLNPMPHRLCAVAR